MKREYFPKECFYFEKDTDSLPAFVEVLKNNGCYIGSDSHIRNSKGVLCSKLMRNGYYMTNAAFKERNCYFMEHRVIWCWIKGPIPTGMTITHKDCDKTNNAISNLEVVAQKKNTGEEIQMHSNKLRAIKTLGKVCGWSNKQITALIDTINSTNFVSDDEQHPNVIPSEDIMIAYSTIVDFTRNKAIGKTEEVLNYALGLAGECGEVVDIIKKIVFHGKSYEPSDLLLELGDVLYYLCALCNVLNIDFSEVMLNNNAKLMHRYKDGFSVKQSLNRIEDERDKV